MHAEPPTAREAWLSSGLLLLSLVAVVGLAKMLSPTIEGAVEAANAFRAVVGIVVAGLILLPKRGPRCALPARIDFRAA